MHELIGKQGVWEANGEGENFSVKRGDGKFFEIGMITKGYDRPVIINYGVGKIAAVLKDGKVAVEPEVVTISLDGEHTYEQDRILRASADNPNYSGLPEGIKTGENFLDSQRIIYRDGLTESHVFAATDTPQRKTKDGFVDCKMISLKEFAESADGPGKIALFDAIAAYLTEDELAEVVNAVIERISEQK